MRIFAISDLHVDFEENRQWVLNLSKQDYTADTLILAGDIGDQPSHLVWVFNLLKQIFLNVLYVPGNHDLWVHRNNIPDSIEKYHFVNRIADDHGILRKPTHLRDVSIVPLYGWYDYTFGAPANGLIPAWSDFTACSWPDGFAEKQITDYFLKKNEPFLNVRNRFVISFSHFLPRIDVMPSFIPPKRRILYPVLGTSLLDQHVRKLKSSVHIYGHSHVNQRITLDGVTYINNAFGYPNETAITAKKLIQINVGEV